MRDGATTSHRPQVFVEFGVSPLVSGRGGGATEQTLNCGKMGIKCRGLNPGKEGVKAVFNNLY